MTMDHPVTVRGKNSQMRMAVLHCRTTAAGNGKRTSDMIDLQHLVPN